MSPPSRNGAKPQHTLMGLGWCGTILHNTPNEAQPPPPQIQLHKE